MSLLADLVESLRQKLAESDSALKTTRESVLNWRREANKEFYSVLQKPDSSEQDKINARKKFHDEERQKRKLELEPAYEKRDQIKKDLDSKIEWLNKGYEILNLPVSPTTDAEEPETKKPSKPQTGAVSTAESGADGKSGKAGATGKAFTTPGYHGNLNGKSGKAASDGKAGKSAKRKK